MLERQEIGYSGFVSDIKLVKSNRLKHILLTWKIYQGFDYVDEYKLTGMYCGARARAPYKRKQIHQEYIHKHNKSTGNKHTTSTQKHAQAVSPTRASG